MTELFERFVELFDSNESLTLDQFITEYVEADPDYQSLSLDERIELKRNIFRYIGDAETGEYYSYQPGIERQEFLAASVYRKPRKKFVEAFVNNINVATSLSEFCDRYIDGNDAQDLVKSIPISQYTNWTVPRWARHGDIVLFMHAKTANSNLTKLRTEARNKYASGSGRLNKVEKAIADQLAFHEEYGGKIFAVGRICGKPELDPFIDPNSHYQSRTFCDIDRLFLLERPVDISEFNSFIKITRGAAITPVYGSQFEHLKDIIISKNNVPEYFLNSYSTPYPHQLVNKENWMKLGLEYRNAFTLEIQFRQCYVDYLLKELGDQKTIYMECPCYKGNNPVTFVDNVIKIGSKLLPVEIKLNIKLESNLEGQCEQYCKLDKLVLDKKKNRIANKDELIDDKILVIDTYGVYMFDCNKRNIETVYDLGDLKGCIDLNQLKKVIIRAIS